MRSPRGTLATDDEDGGASEHFRELVREARKRETEQHLEALFLEGLAGEGIAPTPEFWNEFHCGVRARRTVAE